MASTSHLLLSAALLSLFVLAACAAFTFVDDPTACTPGTAAIPVPLVPSCRMYTVSQVCGIRGPYGPRDPPLKERCCLELAAVPSRCRCAALGYMMDHSDFGRLEGFRGCTREAQRSFARRLTRTAECNLTTIDGGMCYSLALAGGEHNKLSAY